MKVIVKCDKYKPPREIKGKGCFMLQSLKKFSDWSLIKMTLRWQHIIAISVIAPSTIAEVHFSSFLRLVYLRLLWSFRPHQTIFIDHMETKMTVTDTKRSKILKNLYISLYFTWNATIIYFSDTTRPEIVQAHQVCFGQTIQSLHGSSFS